MRQILFNTEMVRAILEGRKTVTRRPVKPQPDTDGLVFDPDLGAWADTDARKYKALCCPGDILWVRETWAKDPFGDGFIYPTEVPGAGQKWRPSIHMPRDAARIFLLVTDLRAERLQEITEDGAKAEGAVKSYPYTDPETGKTAFMLDGKGTYRCSFFQIWDSTIKPAERPAYGWDANPWVWVIYFEQISKEKAQKLDNL